MNKLVITGYCLLLTIVLPAQVDIFEIKMSGEYYWGTGEAASLDRAKDGAVKELINSIITFVVTESNLHVEEKEKDIKEYFSAYTKTLSKLQLKNLQVISTSPEYGEFAALAFISKKDFSESIENLKVEIRDLVKLAEQKESTEHLFNTIGDYYRAYLKSFFCPEPISYFSITLNDSLNSVSAFLESKIRTYLSKIKLEVGKASISKDFDEQYDIPIKARYFNAPVNKIACRIDAIENAERSFVKGETKLMLYSQPSALKQNFNLILYPAFDEKNELSDIHRILPLRDIQQITIDFSDVINVDFIYNFESDKVVAFNSNITNLSISSVVWNFGDGKSSSSFNTKHLYDSNGSYNVTLKINGSDDLTVSKTIAVYDNSKPPQNLNTEANDIPKDNNDEEVSSPPLGPVKIPELPSDILDAKDFSSLSKILEKYKAAGKLLYGKRDSFINPFNCFIIIADPSSAEIITLLSPGKQSRTDLRTGEIIYDYTKSFKGKGTLWLEILQ